MVYVLYILWGEGGVCTAPADAQGSPLDGAWGPHGPRELN